MRRRAIQAFRIFRNNPARPARRVIASGRASPFAASWHLNTRFTRPPPPTNHPDARRHIIQADALRNYTRNFTLTFVLSLVCTGFYIWKRDYPTLGPFSKRKTSSLPTGIQSASFSTGSAGSLSAVASFRPPSTGDADPETNKKTIVQEGDAYLSEYADGAAISKTTEEQNYHMGTLTPEEATQKLRKTEESYLIGRGNGVVRYDLVQIPSNNPIEDDHAEKIVSVDQSITPPPEGQEHSDWMFWGVFDGHSGWTTSARLRQALISYVARELNNTYKSALEKSPLKLPTPEAIDTAMKRAFLTLDNDIVNKSVEKTLSKSTKRQSTELLAPALSGSCALLSFYDSSSKLLRVACTGDSRAVLGRKNQGGKWVATPLSEDQTGATPSEVARLRAEHPGEEYVTHRGRILGGLEPSRAFGDASYKWSREVQDKVKKFFFGRTPNSLLKTPPYVTAEPIVTTTKVDPKNGDFVVLATDGLWEMLTNEEVVGLVGRWLENEEQSSNGNSWMSSLFSTQPSKDLPVVKAVGDPKIKEKEGQRAPIRQVQYDIKSTDERFVVEDKNVATHLVRNALGGQDSDLVCALLSLISPTSRRYR